MLPPHPVSRLARHATSCVLALGVLLGAGLARADDPPVEFSDPVRRMLIERGLLNADGSPVTPSAGPTPTPPLTFGQKMRQSASDMVVTSMNFLGVPYQLGGTSENTGFDCSGFTRYIFEHSIGVVLPRRAEEQARAPGLVAIQRDDLKPGDLVFFNTLRRTFSHVGIYVGEGKFIHSPRSGAVVRVEDMRVNNYWRQRFTGARRVPGLRQDSNGGRVDAAMVGHPKELPSDLYSH